MTLSQCANPVYIFTQSTIYSFILIKLIKSYSFAAPLIKINSIWARKYSIFKINYNNIPGKSVNRDNLSICKLQSSGVKRHERNYIFDKIYFIFSSSLLYKHMTILYSLQLKDTQVLRKPFKDRVYWLLIM